MNNFKATQTDWVNVEHSAIIHAAKACILELRSKIEQLEAQASNYPKIPDSSIPPSVAVSDALIKAECALSDVAEGEPECDDGDPAQWAEQRCAETLAIIRPVMKLHKIRTSEWPPQPMPKPPMGQYRTALLKALATPPPEPPTDQEIEEWAEAATEVPLEEMDPDINGWQRCFTKEEFCASIRAALERWGK